MRDEFIVHLSPEKFPMVLCSFVKERVRLMSEKDFRCDLFERTWGIFVL